MLINNSPEKAHYFFGRVQSKFELVAVIKQSERVILGGMRM